ncbi:hypothetical protein B0H13DRAFT_2680092 [Mycena leptocephala]|nr:hypothetical protein B0H13DRAFT_2680092 [Mycena leptocephala]
MPISLCTPSLTASVADSRSGTFLTCVVDYDGCDDTRRRSHSPATATAHAFAHLDGAGVGDGDGDGDGEVQNELEMEMDIAHLAHLGADVDEEAWTEVRRRTWTYALPIALAFGPVLALTVVERG